MPDLNSSHIKSADYDPYRRELLIEFQNGSKYRYPGVPQFHYEGLLKAHSAGKYFHARINRTFHGIKV
jgi:hypothetical protein